jgi:hypothetical protein
MHSRYSHIRAGLKRAAIGSRNDIYSGVNADLILTRRGATRRSKIDPPRTSDQGEREGDLPWDLPPRHSVRVLVGVG